MSGNGSAPITRANRQIDARVSSLIERVHVSRGTGRMVVLLVLTFALFAILRPGIFLNPLNLQTIGVAAPEIGILALAMMLGVAFTLSCVAMLAVVTRDRMADVLERYGPALAIAGQALEILAGLLLVAFGISELVRR